MEELAFILVIHEKKKIGCRIKIKILQVFDIPLEQNFNRRNKRYSWIRLLFAKWGKRVYTSKSENFTWHYCKYWIHHILMNVYFLVHWMHQQCDLVIGAIGITTTRIMLVDLSTGYLYSSVTFMIPMPNSRNNIAAVVKPFQLPVKQICFSILKKIQLSITNPTETK